MASILDHITSIEVRRFEPGDVILEQGGSTGKLLFLVEGAVEIIKDGVPVATSRQSGAVFGELSALLGCSHTATVRALEPCGFRIVDDPKAFLASSPEVCLHVCVLLAGRLDAMNRYLVDVKQQFAGDNHLGMVDGVLDTLMHRAPAAAGRPSASVPRES